MRSPSVPSSGTASGPSLGSRRNPSGRACPVVPGSTCTSAAAAEVPVAASAVPGPSGPPVDHPVACMGTSASVFAGSNSSSKVDRVVPAVEQGSLAASSAAAAVAGQFAAAVVAEPIAVAVAVGPIAAAAAAGIAIVPVIRTGMAYRSFQRAVHFLGC